MLKKQVFIILLLALGAVQIAKAQENKIVILNLKNGYTVKGEIIEQTAQSTKIKTLDGEMFEYKTEEITSTVEAKNTSSSNKLFSTTKIFPNINYKGDLIINIGIGLFKNHNNAFLFYNLKQTVPPIPISLEYIVNDELFNKKGALGIGGSFGYISSKIGNYKYSRMVLGVRGYVHYGLVDKLDTYTGIFLGYKGDIHNFTETNYNQSGKITDWKPGVSAFLGCRYFFNDKFAGMAEFGWGVNIVTVGISLKL